MKKYGRKEAIRQVSRQQSDLLEGALYQFLFPLLKELNQILDRRLVGNFLGTIMALVSHRHRNQGLVLSELGGYLLPAYQAPAGTKRLSRLLHSPRWHWQQLLDFLWKRADVRLKELQKRQEAALLLWDESVVEKSESLHLAGLSPVRSMKAARLKRIKPGYFNPPGGRPIFVPGWHWLSLVLVGMQGVPVLATMRWWSTRGVKATDKRSVEREVMRFISEQWGQMVIHVWDRGFAGTPWLTMAFVHSARFVMRWPKYYRLCPPDGEPRVAWQLSRGKRSWGHRLLWDARRRCQRKVGVIAIPVLDPVHRQPLTLVVARRGQGQTPWYILTNEPVHNEADAWRIVLIYARRWQVEMCLRFNKCELAFESPRIQRWDALLKLLLMTTLVYAFLLSLLKAVFLALREQLLRFWGHRTGQRYREASLPLYRLRAALSRLWLTHPPPFLQSLSSG